MAIEIHTAEDLYNIRDNLSGDYIQMADIDLSGYSNFDPIGDFDNPFEGTYDGAEYSISNLTINKQDESYIGLFGDTREVEIKNINLENIYVTGEDYVGGIAGYVRNNVSIVGCVAKGTVSGEGGYAGGIAGYVMDSVDISDCTFEGTAEGDYYTGGIAGYINGNGNVNISNCIVNGSISGSYSGGGIAGQVYSADISACKATVILSGDNQVGGIAGYIYAGAIAECYSSGKATAFDYYGYSGGLVGYGYCDITNCYSGCDIEGAAYIGGLIGYDSGSSITNCYSVGKVSGADSDIGGLIGYASGNISSCYYDTETSGQSDTGKGEPKTTAEMKTQATYIDWDFQNIWGINRLVNDGYPFLKVFEDGGEEPEEPENPYILYFLDTPRVTIEPPSANVVTVISDSSEYTAREAGISDDEVIHRIVEIDEGNYDVCRTVAKQLLSRWGREQKSIEGKIRLCQGLDFLKKVHIYDAEAMVDEDMRIQKLVHDVIEQTTVVTAGDIILSDDELLARILDSI
ncbi:GLUG motif-containing protein [Halocella sp. SP3-1]|uniref:GLUG motif-containing protein n=1 Tax=Halocella sp. SP3-1 TaxID=2382161 RepID=UPI000F765AB7|nr:GLUG motif-containing protein [Halocella sp. SP3-1]AZO95289.1 hypothetical protein D7D81_12180 [Halocella sp. SP3-1]